MIEKPVFLDELGPRLMAFRPFRRASIMAVAGIAALLLFISQTVGTAQELPTATRGTAPLPFDPSEAKSSGSDHAPIDRSGSVRISDPAAATQVGQANPGQWLIDDVVRERTKFKFKVKQANPNPIPATNTTPAAPVEAGIGLRSPDGTRAGGHKRGAEKVTGPINRSPTLGLGNPPSSESRAGSVAAEAEDGRLGAPASHRSLKRSDEHGASTRPNTSRELHDAATSCLEVPVGQPPEGEHWYYRLDRETQRKCWYVRARS
jgi:hypothetical protein